MKIYVAAASAEYPRANKWAEVIRSNPDLKLASSWHDSAKAWAGKDARLPLIDQRNVASLDLTQLCNSEVCWLMFPTVPSAGAFVELGFALAYRLKVIVSGPGCANSIFTSLAASRFYDDADAYAAIVKLTRMDDTQPMTAIGRAHAQVRP